MAYADLFGALDGLFRIPTEVIRLENNGLIGCLQGIGKRVRVNAHAHGIGSRFQNGDDAGAVDAGAQAFERRGDGRGMMGEIVVEGDPVDARAHFQTAPDVLERTQCGRGFFGIYARVVGCGDGGKRVHHIVPAGQVPFHDATGLASMVQLESAAVGCQQIGAPNGVLGAFFQSRFLDRSPAAHLQDFAEGFVRLRSDDETVSRDAAYQMVKLPLNRGQVGKNVGVVEFQIIENRRARTVMDELGAFVEKRGVVLVGFDDEESAVAQPRGQAEVERNASDQKTGLESRAFENPGQHARCGGFAVRSGYGQHPGVLQHVAVKPLRTRRVGDPPIEHRFYFRIAAGDGIAYDDQIRRRVQIRRAVTGHERDTLLFELGAHGGINVLVGAGYLMAHLFGHDRQTAHECPADAQNVNVHCPVLLSFWSVIS